MNLSLQALDFLHLEDMLVVCIGLRSLHENIDTTSSAGKFQFHVFSALAEFERDLIRERTLAGLQAARARGRVGGRKREMMLEKVKMAAKLLRDGTIQVQ